MSIYAGPILRLQLPVSRKYKACGETHTCQEWFEIYAMGVPAHIGHPRDYPDRDPYEDWLPPPVTNSEHDQGIPRAIVFLTEDLACDQKIGSYLHALKEDYGPEHGDMAWAEFNETLDSIDWSTRRADGADQKLSRPTPEQHQRYIDPLLTIPGREFLSMSLVDALERLQSILHERYGTSLMDESEYAKD